MGVDVAYGGEDMIEEKMRAYVDTYLGAILGASLILGVTIGLYFSLNTPI